MSATVPTGVPADHLMGHVRAYATAVRAHLGDLPPELADDLTDGLEADLADALEDPAGPVATGEIPLVRPGAGGPGAGVIDLRARFGPAADYAAELRAAAGVAPSAVLQRPTIGDGVRGIGERLAERVRGAARPLTSSRHWPAIEDVVLALRPVWWVLRGWVWFVVLSWFGSAFYQSPLLPRGFGGFVVLTGLVLLSVQLARGRLVPTARWVQRLARAAHVVAVVLVVPLLIVFWNAVISPAAHGSSVTYVEGPTQQIEPDAGVWVDGMRVSNLFVYDADGNPVDGAQLYDDRGRQVRTVDGDEWAEWSLPGVDEPWSFAPVEDAEGRLRWNVYPLLGAPWDVWEDDGDGTRVVPDGLRHPPRPFAKAPAVPERADATAPDASDASDTETEPALPGAGTAPEAEGADDADGALDDTAAPGAGGPETSESDTGDGDPRAPDAGEAPPGGDAPDTPAATD